MRDTFRIGSKEIKYYDRKPTFDEKRKYKEKYKQCQYIAKMVNHDMGMDWTNLYCVTNEDDVNELLNSMYNLNDLDGKTDWGANMDHITHHFVDYVDTAELFVFKNH